MMRRNRQGDQANSVEKKRICPLQLEVDFKSGVKVSNEEVEPGLIKGSSLKRTNLSHNGGKRIKV